MNCLDWEERIALYAGADLDPQDAAAVERHLRECAGCQVFASGLAESLACVRTAHAAEIAPARYTALRARVMASVAREQSRWHWAWIYAAAAAAVVVTLSIGLRPRISGDITPALSQASPIRPLVPVPELKPSRPIRSHSALTRTTPPRPQPHSEQVLVKVETDNPDVVIFWIADTKGEN